MPRGRTHRRDLLSSPAVAAVDLDDDMLLEMVCDVCEIVGKVMSCLCVDGFKKK